MSRAPLARAAALCLALAACASVPTPPDPDAGPDAQALADAIARVAEAVCLPAQRTGGGAAVFIGRAGAASLGLRPAPLPDSGWVAADGSQVFVGERQGACFAHAKAPPPGTAPALIRTLAASTGARLLPGRRAADGALVRRVCRTGTSLSVIAGRGPDGADTLGVAAAPRPTPCGAFAPPEPQAKPGA